MNRSPNIPLKWIFSLASAVILAAIVSSLAVLFFIPSPTPVQYRITIALVCFALSSIAGLLFASKVELSGTIGVLTLTLGGTAALWLAAMLVFNYIYPEGSISRPQVDLRLNLFFPDLGNAQITKVQLYVTKRSEQPPSISDTSPEFGFMGDVYVRLDRLKPGDKFRVVAYAADTTEWNSADIEVPNAQIVMKRTRGQTQ